MFINVFKAKLIGVKNFLIFDNKSFVLAILIVLLLSISLFLVIKSILFYIEQAKTKRRVRSGFDEEADILDSLLLKGFSVFYPPARLFLRWSFFSQQIKVLKELLKIKGVKSELVALASVCIAAINVVGLVSFMVTRRVDSTLVCLAVAIAGFFSMIHSRNERQLSKMREEVPESLRIMSSCFNSGLSAPQTFEELSRQTEGPLAQIYLQVVAQFRIGNTYSEAFDVLKKSSLKELQFVAIALQVQHTTGGSIQHIINSVYESISEENELQRSLRVQTAQAKLSARIVSVMPFLLIGLFTLVSHDFLSPFFENLIGIVTLFLAICLQLTGVLLIRKMVRREAELV